MAITPRLFITPKDAPTAQTTEYTAQNVKAIIDKMTVTNTTAGNITLSVNLVPDGGAAAATNKIISEQTVFPGQSYSCHPVTGQVIEAGGFISVIASATGLTISASGREVS